MHEPVHFFISALENFFKNCAGSGRVSCAVPIVDLALFLILFSFFIVSLNHETCLQPNIVVQIKTHTMGFQNINLNDHRIYIISNEHTPKH